APGRQAAHEPAGAQPARPHPAARRHPRTHAAGRRRARATGVRPMSTTTRQFMFSAVLLALPVCAYFAVFRPVNAKIELGRKEIEHKQALLGKLREATGQTADLARANDQIRESIDSLQSKLPNSKEMDNVLRQVSNIAGKNGLK